MELNLKEANRKRGSSNFCSEKGETVRLGVKANLRGDQKTRRKLWNKYSHEHLTDEILYLTIERQLRVVHKIWLYTLYFCVGTNRINYLCMKASFHFLTESYILDCKRNCGFQQNFGNLHYYLYKDHCQMHIHWYLKDGNVLKWITLRDWRISAEM